MPNSSSLPKYPKTRSYYSSRRLTSASMVGQAARYNPGSANERKVEGQTSAIFAIRDTLLADHLTPFGLLLSFLAKCFVLHARISCYWPSPSSVTLPTCQLIPTCASALWLLLLSCHLKCYFLPASCSPRAFCYWPLSLAAIWPCCTSNTI